MELNQIKYLVINLKNKSLKIIKQPELLSLYFNEYLKDSLLGSNIDNYILSYPKSGRTWLYEILKLYSCNRNYNNFIRNRKKIKFNNEFIKFIHDCSDPNPYPVKAIKQKFKNKDLNSKKKIILLRDPREIIISFWYQMKFREKTYNLNISEFIDDEYLGIKKIIYFYNLIDTKILNNFEIVTYSELVKNTFHEVKKILSFFDLEIDEKLIKKCIKDCSFHKLQKKEMVNSNVKDIKSLKFRVGASGDFKSNLSNQDLLKINDIIQAELNENFKKILKLENI